MTDTGNMMAAFHFEKAVSDFNKNVKEQRATAEAAGEEFNQNEIMPIIGCEFNVCKDHTR